MLERVKKATRFMITLVQKVLLAVSLFIIYTAGLGGTLLLMMLFKRKALYGQYEDPDSYWRKASGYGEDDANCRQA